MTRIMHGLVFYAAFPRYTVHVSRAGTVVAITDRWTGRVVVYRGRERYQTAVP